MSRPPGRRTTRALAVLALLTSCAALTLAALNSR